MILMSAWPKVPAAAHTGIRPSGFFAACASLDRFSPFRRLVRASLSYFATGMRITSHGPLISRDIIIIAPMMAHQQISFRCHKIGSPHAIDRGFGKPNMQQHIFHFSLCALYFIPGPAAGQLGRKCAQRNACPHFTVEAPRVDELAEPAPGQAP